MEGALDVKFVSEPVGSEPMASSGVMSNLEKVLVVHVLIIGTIFHTYAGNSADAQRRMKSLHDMLDGGALDAFGPSGIVEVHFSSSTLRISRLNSLFKYQIPFENSSSPSLFLQVTHPRIIFAMGFLVSSVAKRDPVGRKPKRKVFAAEGLAVLEREAKKGVEGMWTFVGSPC